MKGLDLARDYYFDCIKPLIDQHLPEIKGKYSVALIGYGSDVIGNDDEMSRDHEWGPRCHIFLGEDNHSRYADRLNTMLNEKLPVEFNGFLTRFHLTEHWMSIPAGDSSGYHHVVITTPRRFLELTIGYPGGPETDVDWLAVPEQRLLEFTAGEVFEDNTGEVTGLRSMLEYFPDDVWRYRIAYILKCLGEEDDLITMCGVRKDDISKRLTTAGAVEYVIRLVFLLNRTYTPYAKWFSREFGKLAEIAGGIEDDLLLMLELKDHYRIIDVLNGIYERLLAVMEKKNLCKAYPAVYKRLPCAIRFDMQASAKDVLNGISGPLKDFVIDGLPIGAVDQWTGNSDVILSAEHMKSILPVYKAKSLLRNRLGDLMI